MLFYLRSRAFAGVEWVGDDTYARTIDSGWLVASLASAYQIRVDIFSIDKGKAEFELIDKITAQLQSLFDMAIEPYNVNRALGNLAVGNPGIRVPGAFNGFEIAVRAILGQQITVKAATTLSGRFSQRFGTPPSGGFENAPTQLQVVFPSAAVIATVEYDQIALLGIISRRAQAIIALAKAVESGSINLEPQTNIQKINDVIVALCALPGVGPWTANYIAMRTLKWADALPAADVALYKVLGVKNAKAVELATERYRPYRAYAVMHLWHGLETT